MKKKDEIILEIADVNFPNKAYGYYEGEKVIVKNAVPGQKVQAQVFNTKSAAKRIIAIFFIFFPSFLTSSVLMCRLRR